MPLTTRVGGGDGGGDLILARLRIRGPRLSFVWFVFVERREIRFRTSREYPPPPTTVLNPRQTTILLYYIIHGPSFRNIRSRLFTLLYIVYTLYIACMYSVIRQLFFSLSVLIKNRHDRPSFFWLHDRHDGGSISRAKFNKRFFTTKTH